VEVRLDIAADDTPQRPHQVVHLTRVRATDSVGDTNSVDANLVDSAVDREEVGELGAERVLGRETDLDTLGLDELDDFDGAGVVSGDE
jgi:hypothetical protein